MEHYDHEKIEQAVRMILEAIGEDPDRDGLIDTPSRVARMYGEIFAGLHKDPAENLKVTFATEGHDELVLVKDIPFNSFCEHHLVPFYGVAHIGYIPSGGRVVGLSNWSGLCKISRPGPSCRSGSRPRSPAPSCRSLNPKA